MNSPFMLDQYTMVGPIHGWAGGGKGGLRGGQKVVGITLGTGNFKTGSIGLETNLD